MCLTFVSGQSKSVCLAICLQMSTSQCLTAELALATEGQVKQ